MSTKPGKAGGKVAMVGATTGDEGGGATPGEPGEDGEIAALLEVLFRVLFEVLFEEVDDEDEEATSAAASAGVRVAADPTPSAALRGTSTAEGVHLTGGHCTTVSPSSA